LWFWHGYAKSKLMPTDRTTSPRGVSGTLQDQADDKPPLPSAAQRALAEAAARRAERDRTRKPSAKEIGGPNGSDPTRYGDWEIKGIASDF
jgi:hypothetical protein